MRVTTGMVVDGRIGTAGESFVESMTVTILVPEGNETFHLGSEDEAALMEAMAEGDRASDNWNRCSPGTPSRGKI